MHSSTGFSRRLTTAGLLALVPLLLLLAVFIASRDQAGASSHREAPLISKDAFADNTDTYVFISPENNENIVLVASWIPFEGPEGGPNYWEWDDNVYYDIYVDVDGDATAEVTYTVSSKVVLNNAGTFLYNTGPIDSPSDNADWVRQQFITVTEYFEPGVQPSGSRAVNAHITPLVANQPTAPANIGSKSTPNYVANLEKPALFNYTAGNGDKIKVFAGQSDDPFFVDLQVFDLLTLRGQKDTGYTTGNNIAVDSLSGFNVHTLVVEVPINRLRRNGENVLGVWAGSRRKAMTAVSGAQATAMDFRQVSRLGMPLVNEVVIPMAAKDIFNTLKPSQDLGAYRDAPTNAILQEAVEDPEIGNLLCTIYQVPMPASGGDCETEYTLGTPRSGRGDIFDIFLTGMVLANPLPINTQNGTVTLPKDFNVNRPKNVQPAEMIRINTTISGTLCSPTPSRLGVLGGDACGFPNGRRLADDVVEIELLAVAGAVYEVLDDRDASFTFNSALVNILTDGVDSNDQPFRSVFPYVAPAQSGQEHLHQNPILGLFFPLIQKTASAAGAVGGATPLAASAGVLALLVVPLAIWRRRK